MNIDKRTFQPMSTWVAILVYGAACVLILVLGFFGPVLAFGVPFAAAHLYDVLSGRMPTNMGDMSWPMLHSLSIWRACCSAIMAIELAIGLRCFRRDRGLYVAWFLAALLTLTTFVLMGAIQ